MAEDAFGDGELEVLKYVYDDRGQSPALHFHSAESVASAFTHLGMQVDVEAALVVLAEKGLMNAEAPGLYSITRDGIALAQRVFG